MAFRRISTLSAEICQSLPHFSASRVPALIKARTLWGVTPRRSAAAVTVILFPIVVFPSLHLALLKVFLIDLVLGVEPP